MVEHGNLLGTDSNFGQALICMGESLRRLADVRYQLDDSVQEKFIQPLTTLKDQDIKNISVYFIVDFKLNFKKNLELSIAFKEKN